MSDARASCRGSCPGATRLCDQLRRRESDARLSEALRAGEGGAERPVFVRSMAEEEEFSLWR